MAGCMVLKSLQKHNSVGGQSDQETGPTGTWGEVEMDFAWQLDQF